MNSIINQGLTIVFIGDSVTDSGRRQSHPPLGTGYVAIIRDRLERTGSTVRIVNSGVDGNRARDLPPRWSADVSAHAPSLLSIAVGINDTWRRFDRDDETSNEAFEMSYRAVLDATPRDVHLVFVEPFVVPVRAGQELWRDDLDGKVEVVRRLAEEYDGVLVETGAAMTAAAARGDVAALAPDGVHPSLDGHEVIAEAWLAATAARRWTLLTD